MPADGIGARQLSASRSQCRICSGYVNGWICGNNVRVRRDVLESRPTESIQRDLLRDEVIDEFRSRLGRALRQRDPSEGKRQEIERDALHRRGHRQGTAVPCSLGAPADGRTRTRGPAPSRYSRRREAASAARRPGRRGLQEADHLPETIRKSTDVARKVLRDGLGPIVVEPGKATDGYSCLVAKMGLELRPLLAVGGNLPIDVVAGAS